mgnify:FL=1
MSKLSIRSLIKLISKRPTATKTKKMKYVENINQSTRSTISKEYYNDQNAEILPTPLKDLTQQIKDYDNLFNKRIALAEKARDGYKQVKKAEKLKAKINKNIEKNFISNNDLSKLTDKLNNFQNPFTDALKYLKAVEEKEKETSEYVEALIKELAKAKQLRGAASALRKDLTNIEKFNAELTKAQRTNDNTTLAKILLAVKKLLDVESKLNMDIHVYNEALIPTQENISNPPYSKDTLENLGWSNSDIKKPLKETIDKMGAVSELTAKIEKISKEEERIIKSIDTASDKFTEINENILSNISEWTTPKDFERYLGILNRSI